MPESTIGLDDPRTSDVRALIERHVAFGYQHSPLQDVHALDVAGLTDPAITFFSYRADGELLAIAALKILPSGDAELKSMHTAAAARGRGIARALLMYLIDVARARGAYRLNLETGSMDAFAPARALYTSAGFTSCAPFGDYRASRNSTFMTLVLEPPAPRSDP